MLGRGLDLAVEVTFEDHLGQGLSLRWAFTFLQGFRQHGVIALIANSNSGFDLQLDIRMAECCSCLFLNG